LVIKVTLAPGHKAKVYCFMMVLSQLGAKSWPKGDTTGDGAAMKYASAFIWHPKQFRSQQDDDT